MPTTRRFPFLLCLTLLLSHHPARAADTPPLTRIPLVLNECLPNRTVPWPITTGIPFPRGQLTDPAQCRLLDDEGKEQPLQVKVAATWDAAKSSIRWLTIDFLAQPGRTYALELSPTIHRTDVVPIDVVQDGSTLKIVTARWIAVFSADGPAPLQEYAVWRRPFAVGHEKVAAGAADGQHYYIDQHGQRFTCLADGPDRQVVLESIGPVRTCVRVDGFYTGPQGQRHVAYRTRYHLNNRLPLIRIVDEFRILTSTADTQFQDIGFALDVLPATPHRVVYAAPADDVAAESVKIPWTANTQAISSFQQSYHHLGNLDCVAGVAHTTDAGEQFLAQPPRVAPWLLVTDKHFGIVGSLRHFWQQFPKEWIVTDKRLTLHLWSPRAGLLDFNTAGALAFLGPAGKAQLIDKPSVQNRKSAPVEYLKNFGGYDHVLRNAVDGQGIAKHHEFYFYFSPFDSEDELQYARLADNPPLALASGAWNTSTDVFGPLIARPNNFPQYEAIVDRQFDLARTAQDEYGDYGWWFFGAGPHYVYTWDEKLQRHHVEPVRFEFHTYQRDMQHWWNYFRSGERKFLDWALPSEDHWTDIAVAHVPLTYHCDWRGGETEPDRKLHWPAGDWSIDGPIHYLRHHDSAEAWLRGASQFWGSYHRSLETTTLAYYLTGDERHQEVLNYWRDYWKDLAGVTAASTNVQPWHREQPWFPRATSAPSHSRVVGDAVVEPHVTTEYPSPTPANNTPPKTWAELIRDYAPFNSGSRHQLSLFFNLATLYEHTWDPAIGQVTREYADAFLDPTSPTGVWQNQENRPPANAETPIMAHFWAPALWKYTRATQDPRMPATLQRYYDAVYAADPLREDVGSYSDAHPAYAYALNHDPKHLRAAAAALRALLPLAEPITNPNDWRPRLFNPYAPIQGFAAVPRLLWALDQAQQRGHAVDPDVPMTLQRTIIGMRKRPNEKLVVKTWSFYTWSSIDGPGFSFPSNCNWGDPKLPAIVQPFDRVTPRFHANFHTEELAADEPAGDCFLTTSALETAVLEIQGADALCANAARPLALAASETWHTRTPPGQSLLTLQTSPGLTLEVRGPTGIIPGKKQNDAWQYEVLPSTDYQIRNTTTRTGYWQINGWPEEQTWASLRSPVPEGFGSAGPADPNLPIQTPFLFAKIALRQAPRLSFDPTATYVPGRLPDTQAALILPGRDLQLPDHILIDGQPVRLFDPKQGRIEFWIKRLWDDRLTAPQRVTFLDNGLLSAINTQPMPLNEWSHVVIVWAPLQRDPQRIALHTYINGIDTASYRSIWWDGYGSDLALVSDQPDKWKKHFLLRAPATLRGTPGFAGAPEFFGQPAIPGIEIGAFAIQDILLSTDPLYTPDVDLGHQHPHNPRSIPTPKGPTIPDAHTLLYYPLNGNLTGSAPQHHQPLTGQFLTP